MGLTDYLLYRLAKRWPSPMREMRVRIDAEPGTEEYERAYAQDQFNKKVRQGLSIPVHGLDVLEVGCGHGGVTCFLAVAGARSVVGIDINDRNLLRARDFVETQERRLGSGCKLPITLVEMNAYHLGFEAESFDVVVCDNSFEHFAKPDVVMREAARVLRPGGRLLVPVFSSIYSKYGLHLKNGLKLPWANLLFSERTIVRAMLRLAADDPKLVEIYPGLADSPERVRDLRRYKDLNDMTFGRFKAMAAETGLEVEWFKPLPTPAGHVVRRLPVLRNTRLMDVLSQGAGACLRKPRDRSPESRAA
jgi:ubiquinone/menaquinone biosynthesis C-methylase UbiE